MTYVIQWKKNRIGRWVDYPGGDFTSLNLAVETMNEARKKYPASIFRIRKRNPRT